MKPTAPETSRPLDICAILDACARNQVSELTYGGLFVKFQPSSHGETRVEGTDEIAAGETAAVTAPQAKVVEKVVFVSDEDREALEAMRLDQLANDNPEAYEDEISRALTQDPPDAARVEAR